MLKHEVAIALQLYRELIDVEDRVCAKDLLKRG